ncbi:unnamed protein product, partial [Meganyctiphanes norvegica]
PSATVICGRNTDWLMMKALLLLSMLAALEPWSQAVPQWPPQAMLDFVPLSGERNGIYSEPEDSLSSIVGAINVNQLAIQKILRTLKKDIICPEPFFPILGECFYAEHNINLNWEGSNKFCKAMGSQLAEPKHIEAVYSHLKSKRGDKKILYWIGARSDGDVNGTWTWNSGDSVTANQWSPGQPNHQAGVPVCLDIWLGSETESPGTGDFGCDNKGHMLCEIEPIVL